MAKRVNLEHWPEILSVDEAAQLLHVDRKTLYEAIRQGEFPARRIGTRTIRIHKQALVRWLSAAPFAP